MPSLEDFISKARAKNMSDDDIKQLLIERGWKEQDVNLALDGLEVPSPGPEQAVEQKTAEHSERNKRPALGSLEAALLHVLLWFFTGASSIAIGGVASSLFGGSVSPEALAAMIAVSVITFTPYVIFFLSYLRKSKKTPEIIPGRVWSIITICIHSIGAMAAAITLTVSAIMGSGLSVIVGSALIAVLNIIVLANYAQAAFARPSKLRRVILHLHLILLAVLLGSLFTVSLIRLVPARADTQTQEDLSAAVFNVVNYTDRHGKLPTQEEINLPDGVSYQSTGLSTYSVCANFNLDTSNRYSNPGNTDVQEDSYVSPYNFDAHGKGEHCFEFESSTIKNKINSPGVTTEIRAPVFMN